jgi:hypothetical protein
VTPPGPTCLFPAANFVKSPAFDLLLMFQVRSACGSVSAPGIPTPMPGPTRLPLTLQSMLYGVT